MPDARTSPEGDVAAPAFRRPYPPDHDVLALSNPIPEIHPSEAVAAGAAFAADGKSVNNALAFPGLFRAALDTGAPAITVR